MLKKFSKIIIKKGYSYEGKQVQFIDKKLLMIKINFKKKLIN